MQAFADRFDKLVPPLLALLGLLSTFVLTWLKDLTLVSRRTRVLGEAAQRQAFWKDWAANLATLTALGPGDHELAEGEIRRAAEIVRQLYLYAPMPDAWTPDSFRGYQKRVGMLRRIFVAYAMPTPRLASFQASFRLAVVMYLGSGFLLSWTRYFYAHHLSVSNPFWLWLATSVQQHSRLYLNLLAVCYLWFLVVTVVTRIRLEIAESHWLGTQAKGIPARPH